MVSLLLETWRYFSSHDGRLLSGAVAFYATLAIAPLGVVALLIASLVMPEAEARAELIQQVSVVMGEELASFVVNAIDNLGDRASGWTAPILGVLFMLYMAGRVFGMLRQALNQMWGIRPRLLSRISRVETFHLIERRLLAFGIVIVFGSSLIALVLAHSAATVTARFLGDSRYALTLAEFGSAFAILTSLTALVYRWLPDAVIAWRDVWVGAAVTCLFVLGGSYLIGIYLGYASPASAYGAAGSVIVLLLWIYYTAQIFLMGAVFTRAWARRRGRAIEPLPYADVVETRDYSAAPAPHER